MQNNQSIIPGIVYTKHKYIDKQKWDECILKSHNGLIYSTAAYLDSMAGSWDALILNDYEAVMPLPWRKKFGIQYIYPPAFTQQLGISFRHKEDKETVAAFIKAIPKKFRYIEINLNATNRLKDDSTAARKNYLLNLSLGYPELRKAYSRSALRNISKAENKQIYIKENAAAGDIIKLHRSRFKDEIGVDANDYKNFLSLANNLKTTNHYYCIAAFNNKDVLIAGSIYFIFKDRISFVVNGNTAESLENGATHLLMDYTIKKFSGRGFVLDFEGSDHPSFARFYQQYGALPETYNFIRLNRLPWPLKFLKPHHSNPELC